MIKIVENVNEASKCDEFLTKLILDERQYDGTIDEGFVVKDYFPNIFNRDGNILLVEVIGEEIVAYIFAKKTGEEVTGYLIDGLYVESEYRKRGIAKSLINEVLDMCKNNGVSFVDINVMYKNELAKSLYKSLGFYELRVSLRKDL